MEMMPEDYENRKIKYMEMQRELEATNQSLYDCKRLLKTATVLEAEYQEEIATLRADIGTIDAKWQCKVQQIEERRLGEVREYEERVKVLEEQAGERDERIASLSGELEAIRGAAAGAGGDHPDSFNEDCDTSKLLHDINSLKQEKDEISVLYEASVKQVSLLEANIAELHKEIEFLKDSRQCEKEQLEEANRLLHTAQDDLACCQADLDSIKRKPLDVDNQGNSLFAEVNDRRVQLQDRMTQMQLKYKEMKNNHSTNMRKISNLLNENARLCELWKSENESVASDNDLVLNACKLEIKTLKQLIEHYKAETAKYNELTSSSASISEKFYENMMNLKKKEVESLRNELQLKSLNYTLISRDLAQSHRELSKWRLQATQNQYEIQKLSLTLEQSKLIDSPAPAESVNSFSDVECDDGSGVLALKKDPDTELSANNKDEDQLRRSRRETIYVLNNPNSVNTVGKVTKEDGGKKENVQIATEANKENRRVCFSAQVKDDVTSSESVTKPIGRRLVIPKTIHITGKPKQ